MSNSNYQINRMPETVPAERLAALDGVETATIGHFRLLGFMHPRIKPLSTGKTIRGTAVTLALPGLDSTLLHHVVGQLRPGDVLVIDRLGEDRVSCLGGGVAFALKQRGVLATVIDGPCNDPYEILDLGFPVWSSGISPITTRLYDTGGAFNVPVCCAGAVVMPGDVVLADDNGVVVFHPDEIQAVAEKALFLQRSEKQLLPEIGLERQLGEFTGATKMVNAALMRGT